MKRLWALLIGLLLVVGCCRNDSRPAISTPAQITYGMQATVALVQLKPNQYPRTYCSGVWIGPATILTAAHCVADLGLGGVVNFSQYADSDWGPGHEARLKETHGGTVIRIDEDADLAIIRGVGSPHPVVPLASKVTAGDHVLVVGHPVGLIWNQTEGYVTAVRWLTDNSNSHVELMVQVASQVWYGNSGGPAFDKDGNLVGVASYIIPGSGLSFFVSYYEINRFLAGAL